MNTVVVTIQSESYSTAQLVELVRENGINRFPEINDIKWAISFLDLEQYPHLAPHLNIGE